MVNSVAGLSVSEFTFPGRYPKINKEVTYLKGSTHQTHTPHAEVQLLSLYSHSVAHRLRVSLETSLNEGFLLFPESCQAREVQELKIRHYHHFLRSFKFVIYAIKRLFGDK